MAEYSEGHRKRLKEKYLINSESIVHDYEILELLLTYSIPRKDVKPTAKRLLEHFGSLENVINASPDQLQKVDGIGTSSAILVSLVGNINKRADRSKNLKITKIDNCRMAEKYFENLLSNEKYEKLAVMCLDNSSRIISCKTTAEGTVNFIEFNPRRIVEAIITDNASKIIIAHNHPKGNEHPSENDINFTLKLRDLLRPLGIELCDHIIVGERKTLSMRSSLSYSMYFKK